MMPSIFSTIMLRTPERSKAKSGRGSNSPGPKSTGAINISGRWWALPLNWMWLVSIHWTCCNCLALSVWKTVCVAPVSNITRRGWPATRQVVTICLQRASGAICMSCSAIEGVATAGGVASGAATGAGATGAGVATGVVGCVAQPQRSAAMAQKRRGNVFIRV